MLVLKFLEIPEQFVCLALVLPELMGLGDHLVEVYLVWQDKLFEKIYKIISEGLDRDILVEQLEDTVGEIA